MGSLASVPCSFKKLNDEQWLFCEHLYSAFTFESPHTLHLGILKPLKNYAVTYIGSATFCTKPVLELEEVSRYRALRGVCYKCKCAARVNL